MLILAILIFLIYTLYDQFGMDRLKGKTLVKVRLKKQAKLDTAIFIGLLLLLIYQAYLQGEGIASLSLFLLAGCVLLSLYAAFIRSPVLILKKAGFFFANLYFEYDKIRAVNLADGNVIVIDLKNGKRLLALVADPQDTERIVAFFGGYKDQSRKQHKEG